MPQLMPLYWNISMLMIIYMILVLSVMFYNYEIKMINKYFNEWWCKNKYNMIWLW